MLSSSKLADSLRATSFCGEGDVSSGETLHRSVGDITFTLAAPVDDAAIRQFLASQSMPGPIRLRIEAEPSFFAAAALMGDHADVLIARHNPTRQIVGLGVRAVRHFKHEGITRRIGHLSHLRVAPRHRRAGFLRAAYGLLHDLQQQDPVEFCLSAILSKNTAARRLLESRARGLPIYTPVKTIYTFTFHAEARRFHRRGPNQPSSPHAIIKDQRAIRQTVIEGYSPSLTFLRPLYNALQFLQRKPGLPAPGILNMAYISQLQTADQSDFNDALQALAAQAREKKIDFLTLSLPAEHPFAPLARELAAHTTESILYTVHWPEDPAPELPRVIPFVEAALL